MNYATYLCSFSHIYAFAICNITYRYIIYYEELPTPKCYYFRYALFGGMLIGLLSQIRNTNIFFAVVHIFYGVYNLSSLKLRFKKYVCLLEYARI